jgi:hypothetical protein
MALCERCGSISVAKATPGRIDNVVRFLTSRRPFLCRRCGWRGRRAWTDRELERLREYGAGGAEPDPTLTTLDDIVESGGNAKSRARRKRKLAKAVEVEREFGLVGLDLGKDESSNRQAEHNAPSLSSQSQRSRFVRKRRTRSRRREIIATIAVTAGLMFIVVMLNLSGSCAMSETL